MIKTSGLNGRARESEAIKGGQKLEGGRDKKTNTTTMKSTTVFTLCGFLVSLVSAQELCMSRPGLSAVCGAECNLRGHNSGEWADGQCCCDKGMKRDVMDKEAAMKAIFNGTVFLGDDEKSVHIEQGNTVSRLSCSACNLAGAGPLCCELSCKSAGRNSGNCQDNVCVCGD